MVVAYRDKTIEAVADDFFDALTSIRLELAEDGLIPHCYGASLNVYPSGMTRDMFQGTVAYRNRKGEQSTRADAVNIFASGPDVVPSTVKEQETFYSEWLDSFLSDWLGSLDQR